MKWKNRERKVSTMFKQVKLNIFTNSMNTEFQNLEYDFDLWHQLFLWSLGQFLAGQSHTDS